MALPPPECSEEQNKKEGMRILEQSSSTSIYIKIQNFSYLITIQQLIDDTIKFILDTAMNPHVDLKNKRIKGSLAVLKLTFSQIMNTYFSLELSGPF